MFWKVVEIEGCLDLMFRINVALPNGHAELLQLLPSSTVQDLRAKAQRAFGKKYLKLITAKNRVLVPFEQTLEETEIQDGEYLTALVLQPQLAATEGAFALWCHGDSAIVSWGDAYRGGDSSAVRDQLKGLHHAAILEDGSVVTWGRADYGGDSSAVRDQVQGVQQIQATNRAFVAILEDGSIVTWGDAGFGGDSSAVRDQLKGVQQIQATLYRAFAAIVEDGSVVTWGRADYGGDSSAVRDQLRGVQQIQAAGTAFAAILADGSVVTWGDVGCGGDSLAVRDQLKGVQQIQATYTAFAAILEDGSVVTWGLAGSGGDSSAVQDQLRGVLQIQATMEAFAAILADGSVVTWGVAEDGGDSSAVRDQLRGVQQIQSTKCCDSGRWIRRYLGWCSIWWWQFGSSGSAQGGAADSVHMACICCDSGRWIRRHLGWCKLWRWQFGSPRSAQGCLVSLRMGITRPKLSQESSCLELPLRLVGGSKGWLQTQLVALQCFVWERNVAQVSKLEVLKKLSEWL